MRIQLGVLDILHPRHALTLAPRAEQLGYSRYWLGEHHGSSDQSGSPEVMTAIIAAATQRIRVGPAGVLLRYYTPYKVAQDFRLLEDLFFPRIDLGIARGIGSSPALSELMMDGRATSTEIYERKVGELAHLLQGRLPEGDPAGAVPCYGRVTAPSALWVLGTTERAARLAARVGACFAFSEYLARMTDPDADGPAVVRAYRQSFEPSPGLAAPCWNVAIAGTVARGSTEPLPMLKLAGPPPFVADVAAWGRRLREVAERYESEELIVFDTCERPEDREETLALLAEAAQLTPLA